MTEKSDLSIQAVSQELPAGFDELSAEARAEGHYFLDRLAQEWTAKVMRFNGPGEALLMAHSKDVLAGLGGLTIDPVVPKALRMRRFYVRPRFRRSGIARFIALILIEKAFEQTDLVCLNAAPNSFRFWESLDFVPDQGEGRAHVLRTSRR